jgi:predicted site-specific integrase-resolvase
VIDLEHQADGEPAGPHLMSAELGRRWRVSQRTLDRWREHGKGPAWLSLNGRIRYRLEDVEAFERSRLRP